MVRKSIEIWDCLNLSVNHRHNREWFASLHFWLVVWNMFYCSIQGGIIIIPIDELIFFRGVGRYTTNQISKYTITDEIPWQPPCVGDFPLPCLIFGFTHIFHIFPSFSMPKVLHHRIPWWIPWDSSNRILGIVCEGVYPWVDHMLWGSSHIDLKNRPLKNIW